MTMDRSRVMELNNPPPPGSNNFGIYRPKYDRVEKRIPYKNLNYDKLNQSTKEKLKPAP